MRLFIALCVVLVTLELVSTTYVSRKYQFYRKSFCFSKNKDRPNYEDVRPRPHSRLGGACSDGGACDTMPCGLDGFDCPCTDTSDDEGFPFQIDDDFPKDEDDEDYSDKSLVDTGSYKDAEGQIISYKKYAFWKLYWFNDKISGELKKFYLRDNRRCYFSGTGKNRVEYYYNQAGKKEFYTKHQSLIFDNAWWNINSYNRNRYKRSGDSDSSSNYYHHRNNYDSSSESRYGGYGNNDRDDRKCDTKKIGSPAGYNRVCLAFRDANSIKEGFAKGYRQECLRGQDRCAIEVDKVKGLFHRHCAYRSHCDQLGLVNEFCTPNGCKLFGCQDCRNDLVFSGTPAFGFTKDGTECRCDFLCTFDFGDPRECCQAVCADGQCQQYSQQFKSFCDKK